MFIMTMVEGANTGVRMDDHSSMKAKGDVLERYARFFDAVDAESRLELNSLYRESARGANRPFDDGEELQSRQEHLEHFVNHECGVGKSFFSQKIGYVFRKDCNVVRKRVNAVQHARAWLDLIAYLTEKLGASLALRHRAKFWSEVLAFNLAGLARLFILFAYSRHGALRIPLYADGPELSGYKHRLR